jgi:hypothetical protein
MKTGVYSMYPRLLSRALASSQEGPARGLIRYLTGS